MGCRALAAPSWIPNRDLQAMRATFPPLEQEVPWYGRKRNFLGGGVQKMQKKNFAFLGTI